MNHQGTRSPTHGPESEPGRHRRETPGQHGHAGLPALAANAAQRLADRLTPAVGARAAVSWVHAGAVLAWAAGTGLFDAGIAPAATAAGTLRALDRLAAAHPALAGFADPAVCALREQPIGNADTADITALWSAHPLEDPDHRPHGYLLGNAYQALSAEARRERALAQTPRFVTSLLLDLAFDPAAEEFGIRGLRMVDPSCGTGHILVETLIRAWTWRPRGRSNHAPRGIEAALEAVHGVDLDPYAALLARLRLTVMASAIGRADGGHRGGPRFLPAAAAVNVADADALLDAGEPLLQRGRYHVVVGNPPYITPKDPAVRAAVRAAWPQVCHGKYALSLPFHQLSTALLVPGGWCAQLTANSFMKREFGRPFVEQVLARQDLQWVVDTSGAYLPGHGTPTVILVHRHREPVGDRVTTVRGINGEPSLPADPSQGQVWRAIVEQVDTLLAHRRLAAALERANLAAPQGPCADGQNGSGRGGRSPPARRAPFPHRPRTGARRHAARVRCPQAGGPTVYPAARRLPRPPTIGSTSCSRSSSPPPPPRPALPLLRPPLPGRRPSRCARTSSR
ncbi:Eco57I restriction-modification methylase domain-containing protein [Kitasatospora sp. NPDC088783]|uniref:Eco57I restriction-modification methylase domain-containing protein n=1 Tax=Kitasatospora sp. NPDC088783 TaxID=3364077 RepID=UPI003804D798